MVLDGEKVRLLGEWQTSKKETKTKTQHRAGTTEGLKGGRQTYIHIYMHMYTHTYTYVYIYFNNSEKEDL